LHQDAQHAATVSFDITNLVRTLKSRGEWNYAEMSVTFVMRWLVDRSGRPLPVPEGVKARLSNVKIAALTPGPGQ